MKNQLELPGDEFTSIRAPRAHASSTREKGRRYARSEVCPVCFKPFTPKGIARHVHACRRKETLTRDIVGA